MDLDYIDSKINTLGQEAQTLVNRREAAQKEINELELRLTHIVGAVKELRDMKAELQASLEADNLDDKKLEKAK